MAIGEIKVGNEKWPSKNKEEARQRVREFIGIWKQFFPGQATLVEFTTYDGEAWEQLYLADLEEIIK